MNKVVKVCIHDLTDVGLSQIRSQDLGQAKISIIETLRDLLFSDKLNEIYQQKKWIKKQKPKTFVSFILN